MIGQSIGSYLITAKLGEGGMGTVYLGEHQRIARKAAIKVLLPELSANQQIVARFFNEAQATSLIKHPGIVEIFDCDVLPTGNAFIVMEHLVGESLGSLLRRDGRLSANRATFLTRHVADALAAAHDRRIVHRDLKPDNVFLVANDAQPIKILDFGIAKLTQTDAREGSVKTHTGLLLGTPVYMSPEQCRGVGEIDLRTDIYSLGCMLYEMLCDRPPFTGQGFGELIHSHLSETPARVRSIDPSIPAALDDLVARMLAKAPGERPQTMAALVGELDAVIAGAPARSPAPEDRSAKHRPIAAGGADIPKLQTTLRSASAEKLAVVDLDAGAPGAGTPARRSRLVPGLAVLAVVVVLGGVGIWRSGTRPAAVPAGASLAPAPTRQVGPEVPEPAAPPPPSSLPPRSSPPETTRPSPTPALAAAAEIMPEADKSTRRKGGGRARDGAAGPSTSPKPAAAKVTVAIGSDPSGADVCLASDHVVLGKTDFRWSTEKGARTVKLLVRKRGYRGQDFTVTTDRDATRQVKLYKLGADDIDDIENCKR